MCTSVQRARRAVPLTGRRDEITQSPRRGRNDLPAQASRKSGDGEGARRDWSDGKREDKNQKN